MIDNLDMVRRFYAFKLRKLTPAQKRAVSDYLRISGNVQTPEQIFYNSNFQNETPAIPKIEEPDLEKIGKKIDIFV